MIKHGRSGKQHLRRLYCDVKMEFIYWRELRGFEDGESSDNFDLSAAEEEERSQKRRSHFIRFSKGDDDRKIVINDIIEVRDDLSTDVARRPLSTPSNQLLNSMVSFPSSAICIILPYRMVDFEVDDVSYIYMILILSSLVLILFVTILGLVGNSIPRLRDSDSL